MHDPATANLIVAVLRRKKQSQSIWLDDTLPCGFRVKSAKTTEDFETHSTLFLGVFPPNTHQNAIDRALKELESFTLSLP